MQDSPVRFRVSPLIASCLVALTSVACAPSGEGPVVASSASEPAYAESHPSALERASSDVSAADAEVVRVSEEMPKYPEALRDPDYAVAKEVVERADQAGKSSAYAERADEATALRRFLADEKDKLQQQVSGSVRYALKEKGVTGEALDAGGSAAVHGMNKAIDKQLEERSREANDAHRLIDEHEEELGKANTESLRIQADEIAKARHHVHVVLPAKKLELERLIGDSGSVKSTLEKSLETERAALADEKSSKKRKAVAEARIAAAEAALGSIDQEQKRAEEAHAALEKRIPELEKQYEDALRTLVDRLGEEAKKQEKAAESEAEAAEEKPAEAS